MLGKPQWFQRRKYLGWGIYPKTYQGWVYVAVMVGLLAIIQVIPFINETTRWIITMIWAAIFVIDVIDITVRLPQDERDKVHEAIAERNAMWVMILVLLIGVAYRAAKSALYGQVYIDPVIIIALFAALAVKAITNIYLDHKN